MSEPHFAKPRRGDPIKTCEGSLRSATMHPAIKEVGRCQWCGQAVNVVNERAWKHHRIDIATMVELILMEGEQA